MSATTQRSQDRADFRKFLRSHRYAPQGRLSRVGMLEERDLDAMMRGSVRPVWRWIWRNVKTSNDMELIRRNVRVARHNIDTCKREREEAKTTHEQLESRKQYLLESLRKAKEREKTLLHNLQAVECKQDDMHQAANNARQRELLKRGFTVKNGDVMAHVECNANSLRALVSMESATQKMPPVQGPENPVEVLLKAYLRLLKSSSGQEDIKFGDTDIAHLRGFGGEALVRWLAQALVRAGDASFRDSKEREYAIHVQDHLSSSRDALLHVQAALRQNQKKHIARFVETQAAYLKVKQFQDRTDKHVDAAFEGKAQSLGRSASAIKAGFTGKVSKDGAEEVVELEIEKVVQLAALEKAIGAHAKLKQQVQASKQQKQTLDEKLALMDSFSRRQHDLVAQINVMCSRNKSLIASMGEKQTKLRHFSSERLIPQHRGRGSKLLEHWNRLTMEELRVFAGIRLDRVETVMKSVSMVAGKHHGAKLIRQNLHVPVAKFYINQTKRQDAKNGFARVFRALGVPTFGNWSRLLVELSSSFLKEAIEAHKDRLRALDQEIAEERSGSHASASSRVQTLLVDLQSLTQSMETECFPHLEEMLAINQETQQCTVPRLQTLIEDWYTQSGWAVQIQSRPVTQAGPTHVISAQAPY